MAKLFYNADHGTISARADGDEYRITGDIEVTPEQATALAASNAAHQLGNIAQALFEIEPRIAALRKD